MTKKMTVQEGLREYLSQHGPKALALFCKVERKTALKWKDYVPKGMNLVKVITFLKNKLGYDLEGYSDDQLNYKTILAIGYDHATVEQISNHLGFVYAFDLYPYLFNKGGISKGKEESLRTFLNPLFRAPYVNRDKFIGLGNDTPIVDLKNPSTVKEKFDYPAFITQFKDLTGNLKQIEPKLDELIASTAKDRQMLREKLEENDLSFFKSSNALYRVLDKMNALCSEKSKNTKNY